MSAISDNVLYLKVSGVDIHTMLVRCKQTRRRKHVLCDIMLQLMYARTITE